MRKIYVVLAAAAVALVLGFFAFVCVFVYHQNQSMKAEMSQMKIEFQKKKDTPLPEPQPVVVQLPSQPVPAPMVEVSPRQEKVEPEARPELAKSTAAHVNGRGFASTKEPRENGEKVILIDTLFSASQEATEKIETAAALRKCGDKNQKLFLVIKKAKSSELRPILVVGVPAMNEDNVFKYASCLQARLPKRGKKPSQVEVHSLAQFERGYITVSSAMNLAFQN